ncbi:MAG: D-2-hydroxyacid dehydrogenase [Sulfolobaceae archaeon]|nr:D-2-hydroxyacid dehydrogenase [Sulfolobaceae archaeon]
MRALIIDQVSEKLINSLKSGGIQVSYSPGLPREEVKKSLKDYEILVFRSRLKISKEIIDSGENLRILARYGVGLDNVDIDYAIKKGIAIINAPNAPSISVAELVIGYIVMLNRNLYTVIKMVKEGEWPKGKFIGEEMYGKTIGIVGFGRIGKATARYASLLGMKVLAYDVIDVKKEVQAIGGEQVPLEELLRRSDVISLHVPLTPQTYHMMNDTTFPLIRDGALFINASRGEVVDTVALLKHLDRLGGVALDVLEQEPPKDEIYRKVISHPKVIVTPHIGSETRQAMDRLAEELANNILEAVKRL